MNQEIELPVQNAIILFVSLSVSWPFSVLSTVSMDCQSFDAEHFAIVTIIFSYYIKASLYSFENEYSQHPPTKITHKQSVSNRPHNHTHRRSRKHKSAKAINNVSRGRYSVSQNSSRTPASDMWTLSSSSCLYPTFR